MIDRMKNKARWLLVTAVIVIVAGTVAWALFNARQDVTSNVSTESAWQVSWTPAADLMTVANMAAGDVSYNLARGNRAVAGAPPSVDIIGMATDPDGKGLAQALVLTIRHHTTVSNCDAANFAGNGVEVYSGPVGAEPEITLATNLLMPADFTDDIALCFRLELPSGVNGSLAASTTVITTGFVVHD